MHYCSKGSHGEDVGHEGRETNNHGKFMEKNEVAEKKYAPTKKSGDATRCYAYAHLSVRLTHLLVAFLAW